MKIDPILALLMAIIAALTVVLVFFTPHTVAREKETVYVEVEKPTLSHAQILWLAKLMDCESGVNTGAINPVDRDGTASLGLLQFKQGTYDGFTAKYGIEGDIMDGVSQIAIVEYWILNPGEVDWYWQFPTCVRLYGEPPV